MKLVSIRLSRQAKKIITLFVMGLVAIISVVTVTAFSKQVCIEDDYQTINFVTVYSETDKILEQAGITLNDNDEVIVGNKDAGTIKIRINRENGTVIKLGEKAALFVSEEDTVADVLDKLEVKYNSSDIISPALSTKVQLDTVITVKRSSKINVVVGGEKKEAVVPKGTVENAIAYLGIKFGDNDSLNVEKPSQVKDGMTINIDQVSYKERTETETVSYKTIKTKTASLLSGVTKVKTKGVNGEKKVCFRDKIVNGKVVETTVISSEQTKNPVNEEILVGTKNVVEKTGKTFVDHLGKRVSYKKKLTLKCSAYTAPAGAKMATGKTPKLGYAATNPKEIPFGTVMYVASADGKIVYGYVVAADTGGALKSGRIDLDLFYPTKRECIKFGIRSMSVYILK